MPRIFKIFLSISLVLFAGLACAVIPIFSTPEVGSISTSAAQTIFFGLTQQAAQFTSTPIFLSQEPTLTVTFTQTLPLTATQTATQIPTPFLLIPLISVSTPTNCRSGPGKVYGREGALLIGEFAEVYGRDLTGNYWYIRNPDSGPEFCWVWGKYATLSGVTSLLPILTPPPTPTPTFTPEPTLTPTPFPAFVAKYTSLETCNGSWWLEFSLKNKGSTPLKSLTISVMDKSTDITLVNLADGFFNMDGCLTKTTKDILGLGDTYLISAPAFLYNPTGHEIKIVVTLCSDTGQKGFCVTHKFDVTP